MAEATRVGFREVEHTADWEIEVWAPELDALFEQAARGMYTLSGIQLRSDQRQSQTLQLEATDLESLLVSFLSELLFLAEDQAIGFDRFELQINGSLLKAKLSGAPIAAQTKEVKAVTYHNLNIRRTQRGWEVNVIFDI